MKEHARLARARLGVERRIFLKALSLGIAAPIAWQLSRASVAEAQQKRPIRLLVFYTPHGMPPEHYNPIVNANGMFLDLVAGGAVGNPPPVSILGPFEPYKQYVNVLQGFSYPGGNTHEGILTVLSNFGVMNDETTPRTSFEHVIAAALGTEPLILGAIPHRVWGLDKDGKLFWDNQPVVPQSNPLTAYDATFGGLGANAGDLAVKTQLRDALTALTTSQLNNMSQALGNLTKVQSKLAVHLEALQSLRSSSTNAQSCTTAPDLPAIDSLRSASQGQPPEYFLSEENFPALLAAQMQLAAQSIICNAAPVIGLQPMYTNADINFAFMGSTGSHHSVLSHTGPVAEGTGLALATRVPFAKAQRWFYEQLVEHVVSKLTIPDPADPGRQVIDNTIIYMFSEIGEGAWHTSQTKPIQLGATPNAYAYMPIVTLGGGGGALKAGQVVNVNPNAAGTDRPAGDIYLALAKAMGVSVASFGNATNPLTEILAS